MKKSKTSKLTGSVSQFFPEILFRGDGTKFVRNEDGTYSLEKTHMVPPYKWSLSYLLATKKFSISKPKRL